MATGLFTKFFRRKEATSDATMTPRIAVEIIQRFGSVLENEAPVPGCVADVTKLPFPKEKIREALIFGLRANVDPKMKEMLKTAYIELANWQRGVGPADQGIDTSKLNAEDDVESRARSVLAQTHRQEQWNDIVLKEQAYSKSELEALKLW